MRAIALTFAVAFVVTSGLIAAGQTPAKPSDEHPAFPEGPGRDLTLRVCSQCHDPELCADQQLDAAGWKSVVDQMAGKGAEATDEEFEQIVRYLAKAFPPDK